MKRLTNENFIQKASIIHKNKYDYSLTEYINYNVVVKIICPIHGLFEQKADYHLQGRGCSKCANEHRNDFKKFNNEIFIKKSKEVHGDKYDYSLVSCSNNFDKIKIICPIHGLFEQRPYSHINDQQGCPKCQRNYKKSFNEYLDIFKKVHNKYDYSLVQTINNSTDKIKIICSIHGVFEQKVNAHCRGHGCKKCANLKLKSVKSLNTIEFIQKAKSIHGDKYDYSLVEYHSSKKLIKIICGVHGQFLQRPNNHLQGKGCLKCGGNFLSNTQEFIQKSKNIHGDKYDYSKTKYINCKTKVCIICSKHGEFWQTPSSHLSGNFCCRCVRASKPEKEIFDFIKKNYSGEIIENSKKIIHPYEIDIYLPELKLAIEFNGLYWHNELKKPDNYHLNKTNLCEKKGIHLIHIYEDDWDNKQEIVKSRLLNLLGKSDRVYGRNVIICEVSYKDSKNFLNKNHMLGNCYGKIRLGLYYKEELISLMIFRKFSKEGSFELLRFCNKLNFTVIGGTSKLFKYFINTYKALKIISYADRSWVMNNDKTIYETLGFKKERVIIPNYYYINNDIRENRKNILIKDELEDLKTEHQIMLDRKIYRIYDSGQIKYSYESLVV